MNRFGFAQPEVFNPHGLLFIFDDEEQYNATEEAGDDAGDGQPPQEISDTILATAREAPRQASADDGEEGSENGGASGGTTAGEPRLTDPAPCPREISIRVNFTPGNLRFTVESTLDLPSAGEGSGGTREDQASTTNAVGENGGEVSTSTQPEGSLEGMITPPCCAFRVIYVRSPRGQVMHHREAKSYNPKVLRSSWDHPKIQPQRRLTHRPITTRIPPSRRTAEEESFGVTRVNNFDRGLHHQYRSGSPATTRRTS